MEMVIFSWELCSSLSAAQFADRRGCCEQLLIQGAAIIDQAGARAGDGRVG